MFPSNVSKFADILSRIVFSKHQGSQIQERAKYVGRQDTLEGLHNISTTGPDTLPIGHNKEHLECVSFPARKDNEDAEIRGGLTFHNLTRTRTRNVIVHGQVAGFETGCRLFHQGAFVIWRESR
jgi:hypothetical protein